MSQNNLRASSKLILDCKIHRFATQDKPQHQNGWYAGGFDFVSESGYFSYGDMRTGVEYNINSFSNEKSLSAKDLEEKKQALEKYKKKIQDELRKELEEYLEVNRNFWNSLKDSGSSKYLSKKKIKANNVRFGEGFVAIPLYNTGGEVFGVQKIFDDGSKKFKKGTQKKGNFSIIGDDVKNIKNLNRLFLCEGYATACSINQVTNIPCLVSFDAGNLKNVISSIKNINKDVNIIICGDDDKYSEQNTGKIKALECSDKFGVACIFPRFKNESTKPTDWNDLYCLEGEDEVKKQIFINREVNKALLNTKKKHVLDEVEHLVNSKSYDNVTTKFDNFCNKDLPKMLLCPPGKVGELYDWMFDMSMYPQPVLGILNLIVMVGTILGHRVMLFDRKGAVMSNLYGVGIAVSSAGKDISMSCTKDLLGQCDLFNIYSETPQTDAALINSLVKNNGRVYALVDEVGDYFSKINNTTNSFRAGLLDKIKTLYTGSKHRAMKTDEKKTEETQTISFPCFGMYGAATPDKFYSSISAASTVDGFLSRLLIVEGIDRTENYNVNCELDVPEKVKNIIKDYEALPTNIDFAESDDREYDFSCGEPQRVVKQRRYSCDGEALALLDEYHEMINKRIVKAKSEVERAIYGRSEVKVKKISLILSVDPEDNRYIITTEAMKYAIAFVEYSDKKMIDIAENNIADSRHHKNCQMILNLIRYEADKTGKAVSENYIYKNFAKKMKKKDLTDTIESLMMAGDIVEDIIEEKGRNVRYFIPIYSEEY